MKYYVDSLNLIINGEKESYDIEELFESGKSLEIIDRANYGRANGRGT